MNNVQTIIEESASDADRQFVVQGLVGYNNAQATPATHRDLTVFSRHNGEIVGGLLGYTHGNWLFIKQLWVADTFRRCGLGRGLMRAAEQEARCRGCFHAHCDTYDFQALSFYQKLGYHIFGQLEDYPVGHTRYFLQTRSMNPSSARQRRLSLFLALFASNLSCFVAASAPVTPPQVPTALLIVAPKPEYPDQARQRDLHGSGVFLLRTNIKSGRVTQVIVGQSTLNAWLDDAAVKALRQWRFKPGALTHREITKPRLKPPLSKEECLILVPVTF